MRSKWVHEGVRAMAALPENYTSQSEIHPIRLQVKHAIGVKVHDYLFAHKSTTVENEHDSDEPGNAIEALNVPVIEGNVQKLQKKRSMLLNLHQPKSRAVTCDLPDTKRKTGNFSTLPSQESLYDLGSLADLFPIERLGQYLFAVIPLMAAARVQGPKYPDIFDLVVKGPPFHFESRTWSYSEFFDEIRRTCVSLLFKQSRSILGQIITTARKNKSVPKLMGQKMASGFKFKKRNLFERVNSTPTNARHASTSSLSSTLAGTTINEGSFTTSQDTHMPQNARSPYLATDASSSFEGYHAQNTKESTPRPAFFNQSPQLSGALSTNGNSPTLGSLDLESCETINDNFPTLDNSPPTLDHRSRSYGGTVYCSFTFTSSSDAPRLLIGEIYKWSSDAPAAHNPHPRFCGGTMGASGTDVRARPGGGGRVCNPIPCLLPAAEQLPAGMPARDQLVKAPFFNLVDDGDTTQGLMASICQFAKLNMIDVIEDVNEKHCEPWPEMLSKSNPPITNTPFTPNLPWALLTKNHIAFDGSKIKEVVGFKVKFPGMTEEVIREQVQKFILDGVWPNAPPKKFS
ncbi:hypothetical protein PTTG_30034 [Puccinia triticina 1-1 BBBD Race 1]|uniref:Uncharacterized protein n=1 Tax=Puccinia triticina (isolate 1-1 / race 1 (BBBD)) TaxID=630390 RepID=A0A180G0I1_PUCT1|nr:hypothetical protein PTTG_30034 [Puccinia triticina 1-1 BBBD Race 1]